VLASGDRIPAKCVSIGDELLSATRTGDRVVTVKITAVRYAEDSLMKVDYEAGTLLCSTTHPLMVRDGDLLAEIPASRLQPGTMILLEDLSETRVTSVKPAGKGRVVKITTNGDHLFFAGDAPVLGHNSTGSDTRYKSIYTGVPHLARSGTGAGSGMGRYVV
jgi:hypothetical protein